MQNVLVLSKPFEKLVSKDSRNEIRLFVLDELLSLAQKLVNPPDFTDKEVITNWIETLLQFSDKKIHSIFSNISYSMKNEEMIFFPKLAEFLGIYVQENNIHEDLFSIKNLFNKSSSCSIYDISHEMTHTSFYFMRYIAKSISYLHQVFYYPFNQQQKDVDIKRHLKCIYKKMEEDETFRKTVLECKTPPIISHTVVETEKKGYRYLKAKFEIERNRDLSKLEIMNLMKKNLGFV